MKRFLSLGGLLLSLFVIGGMLLSWGIDKKRATTLDLPPETDRVVLHPDREPSPLTAAPQEPLAAIPEPIADPPQPELIAPAHEAPVAATPEPAAIPKPEAVAPAHEAPVTAIPEPIAATPKSEAVAPAHETPIATAPEPPASPIPAAVAPAHEAPVTATPEPIATTPKSEAVAPAHEAPIATAPEPAATPKPEAVAPAHEAPIATAPEPAAPPIPEAVAPTHEAPVAAPPEPAAVAPAHEAPVATIEAEAVKEAVKAPVEAAAMREEEQVVEAPAERDTAAEEDLAEVEVIVEEEEVAEAAAEFEVEVEEEVAEAPVEAEAVAEEEEVVEFEVEAEEEVAEAPVEAEAVAEEEPIAEGPSEMGDEEVAETEEAASEGPATECPQLCDSSGENLAGNGQEQPVKTQGCCECNPKGCANMDCGFYIAGEFLYWRAENHGFSYAYEVTSSNTGVGKIVRIDPSWTPGFRAGVGWNTEYNFWDVLLNYTWYQNHSTDHRNSSFGFINLWPVSSATQGAFSAIRASSMLRMNMGDLEVGRLIYLAKAVACRFYLGAKGGTLNQTFSDHFTGRLAGDAENQELKFEGKNNYWGVGPRLGLNGEWHLNQGFSLVGKLAGALLYGKTDVSSISTKLPIGSSAFTTNRSYTDHFYQLAPNLQLALGMQWQTCFRSETMFYKISASWEANYWWDQFQLPFATSDIYAPFPTVGNQPLSMEGLTLNMEWDF